MKWLKIGLFLLILFIFVYLRLAPIINQTVPYTFDQGRDFLKTSEIVRDKNLPFIGPESGIQGVYHGVWWYYFLLIPYGIFSGWPQGFYLSLFLFNLLITLFFFRFLKKNYNWTTALFFLALASTSSFFIKTAFYASNNTLAPIFVFVFIYSLYEFFNKKPRYLLLTGISLGFILETELAFGLFIIPAFSIVYLLFKRFKNLLLFFAGLIIPSISRILFEIKNHFIQTRSFIDNLSSPKNVHPLLFRAELEERVRSFWQYWQGLFFKENITLSIVFLILLLISFFLIKKSPKTKKLPVYFLSDLIIIIFLLSLLYKNSFFWTYYLDGIQFIFLFILVSNFYLLTINKKIKLLSYFFLITVVAINLFAFIINITSKKTIPLLGLRADNKIVNYLIKNTNHNYFCLRIYTPPVIPYTYMYLFSYYADQGKIKYPKGDFYNNKCYYIFDEDLYLDRVAVWRKNNIPNNAELIKTVKFENGTNIELWSLILNPNLP